MLHEQTEIPCTGMDRPEALLSEMAAATGCDDAKAERLLARWEVLDRWPDDPPPLTPCGWFRTHRRFWRRPEGGWVCTTCHPAPPGLQVEIWELPATATTPQWSSRSGGGTLPLPEEIEGGLPVKPELLPLA